MNYSLVGDGLAFELRRTRRSTIGITVGRDGSLILSAPEDCPTELIEETARKKRPWVQNKLAEKSFLFRPRSPKEYVTGGGFHYLGRSHRLLLIEAYGDGYSTPALRLRRGRFELHRNERHSAKEHFVAWYARNGRPWVQRRVDLFTDRVRAAPAWVDVRELGYRWGSCGSEGDLNFHWRTVCLPPSIIEYVVVHELVHLVEPHHGTDFWKRVERVILDFDARKRWLAENGHRF
jgi:predicted metal-dependent hydrolase